MSVAGLEKLDVWCRAQDFAVRVHKEIIPLLPSEEKWCLAQQLRRACQSIPANIAEGHGRFYFQDNVRFCYIARGSLEETISHIAFAHKVGYLPDALYRAFAAEAESLNRLINGYIAFLKKSKHGATDPGALRESSTDYILEESCPSSTSNNEYRITNIDFPISHASTTP